jgi:hypothetical protein
MRIQTRKLFSRSVRPNKTTKTFFKYLNLAAHSMIVFERAYNHYLQFAPWTKQRVNFVCRLKSNTVCKVIETRFEQNLQTDKSGILKE